MKNGMFIVEGDISDLNENIFKRLKEVARLEEFEIGENAIEESGGVPVGVKVKNRFIIFNKKTKLLRALVSFQVSK